MKVLVIDGQGGGLGKLLVAGIKKALPDTDVTCVGTNSIATAAMIKAGADRGATGENAAVVCSRDTDVIVGPCGIVIADSLLGEITPAMAVAVGQSRAKRILIPLDMCDNIIAGAGSMSMSSLVEDAVKRLAGLAEEIG